MKTIIFSALMLCSFTVFAKTLSVPEIDGIMYNPKGIPVDQIKFAVKYDCSKGPALPGGYSFRECKPKMNEAKLTPLTKDHKKLRVQFKPFQMSSKFLGRDRSVNFHSYITLKVNGKEFERSELHYYENLDSERQIQWHLKMLKTSTLISIDSKKPEFILPNGEDATQVILDRFTATDDFRVDFKVFDFREHNIYVMVPSVYITNCFLTIENDPRDTNWPFIRDFTLPALNYIFLGVHEDTKVKTSLNVRVNDQRSGSSPMRIKNVVSIESEIKLKELLDFPAHVKKITVDENWNY